MKSKKYLMIKLGITISFVCLLAMTGTAFAEELPAQAVADPTAPTIAATQTATATSTSTATSKETAASTSQVAAESVNALAATSKGTQSTQECVTQTTSTVATASSTSATQQATATQTQTTQTASLQATSATATESSSTASTALAAQESALEAAQEATVDMYRLYNPNSGEHFYTSSKAERLNLIQAGWNYEGIGWVAPETSSTPVYRVYNPYAGDHHYTVDANERDYLINVGWNDEGIGWYSDDSQRIALLRQYNPNAITGAHNFTTAQAENDYLVSLGWEEEGIGWYAVDYGKSSSDFSYIYLDAGHGWGTSGYDSGATGNGYIEADETVELVNLVAQYARDIYGLAVYTNCGSKIPYAQRQQDAYNHGCSSLVSIHFNCGGGTGSESYIHESNPAAGASTLQSIMHTQLVDSLGLHDRGMMSHNWAVCSGAQTGIPAVLLEICFIDNSYDMSVYKAKEQSVARALAAGLNQAAQAGF